MAEKRGSVLDPLSWSDPLVRVYEACVDELLVNLAKHFNVSAMGNIESFRYEVEMLAKMGAIRQETARIIARHIAQNEPMIEEALKTAMLDALETVEPELKHAAAEGLLNGTDMEVSDFVQSKLASYSRQAKNQLNLVNTVMLEGTAEAYRKGVYAAVDIVRQLDAAQETLNVETGKVITGTSTLQQATRAAVKAMSQNGITGFVDRGGHRWSAEAYVRMDLKTTCSNAANRAVMDRNESYGNDLIWVRTNATARPGCYPWQGKVISMQDRARDVTDGNGNRVHAYAVSQTTYGQPDGIFGINCHHGPMNVFVPGLSYIRGAGTAPDQAENDRLYELTQQQRKLERQVRYAKRDAAMYDAAGDKDSSSKAKSDVARYQKRLRELVASNRDSLVRDYSREAIYSRVNGDKNAWAPTKTSAMRRDPAAFYEKKYMKAQEEAQQPVVKFVPAKTKDEAETFAEQFAQTIDYKGVSLKNANIINEQLAVLTSKYPIKKLSEISVGSRGVMSANYRKLLISRNKLGNTLVNAHDDFLRIQQEIRDELKTIKERYAGKQMPFDMRKRVEKHENSLRFSRWGVHETYKDNVKWIVAHEYGHIVSDQYFGLINGDSANPNIKTNWSIKAVSDRWKKIYEKAYKDGDIYKVSQYGATDHKEFFAECFAAREIGENLPDYIEEFMGEVLKNGIL